MSITSVSRVLNGKADKYRIAKKSQDLIMEAAERLNYVPNFSAANLRSGKSKTIALTIPSLNNPFFAYLASEINLSLRKEGFVTILSDTFENNEDEKSILRNLLKRNVEGLILIPSGNDYEHILELQKSGLPIVCVDRYYEDLNLPYVTTNNFKGAFRATEYLIESGHENILCIQGVVKSEPNKERIRGYKEAMFQAGLKNIRVSGNDFSIQNGYLETKLAINSPKRPTAIFTLSNTIAMGSLKAILEEELSIPDDISLITYDDHPYLDFLITPLSCVEQPRADIANMTVKILMSMLSDSEFEVSQVKLDPNLKLRDSVKTLNGKQT